MAHRGDKLLCFLKSVEVKNFYTQVALFRLHSDHLAVAKRRKRVACLVGFDHKQVGFFEVAVVYHAARFVNSLECHVFYRFEFVNQGLRQRREVVVDMFETGIGNTFQAVNDLRNAVAPEVEPCVLFHSRQVVYLSHSYKFLSPHLFPKALFLVKIVCCAVQSLVIVVLQTVYDLQIVVSRKVENLNLIGFDAFSE